MEHCCENEARELSALRLRQARVLRGVLAVNLIAFSIEFSGGIAARSTGLLSDSLDMLGDAFVYGFSLYVLHRGLVWRAVAALTKGALMAGLGVGVLVEAGFRLRAGDLPLASAMAGFAGFALVVNALCFAALYSHRSDDANLRSTWLCTRNDIAANVAVIGAAAIVARTGSRWPDLVVGVAIAALFLRTAVSVIRQALSEIRRPSTVGARGEARFEDERRVMNR